MLDKKKIIFQSLIIIAASIIIPARGVFAQGLSIGGNASFSYTASDNTGKSLTVQESDESFTQNYSLNIKNDLTSKGSIRSAVRYSINNSLGARDEATDLSVDLSYDKISCSIGLQDNTNSDFDVSNISNDKSTDFNFQISPEVLPRFSLSYSTSVKDSEITVNSNNVLNLQFSKNFKIQDSNLSSAFSYTDNSDNSTGEQNTDNRFNLSYGIKLLDDKLSINTGYRIGNSYDVNNAANNSSESGDVGFSYSILENLIVNGDLTRTTDFPSDTGKMDVNNTNNFRLNFIPVKNLNFTTSFSETQSGDKAENNTSKSFSANLPPIFDVAEISYNYSSKETEATLDADNSVDLNLDFGALKVSDFTANARYGTKKSKTIDTDSYTEVGNFGFGVNMQPMENLRFSYTYNLDKTTSNVIDDNKDAIRNSISVDYAIKLMEDLNGSISTAYDNTRDISTYSSGNRTDNSYNGNLNYKLGETNVSFSGSLSRSFDESGVHVSKRTNIGPEISTKFKGVSLAAKVAFGEESSDGELTASDNTNYSLNVVYPFGTLGSSTLSYTVSSVKDLKDPSASTDDEKVSVNMSFSF
ncbi:MAG: hypothetical protein ABII25_08420 [bacterium]